MDSITQAALGALCGELFLSKKLGWKGAAWGAFFGTLPDLDVIAFPWLDAAEQLRWHRGLSHSLLIMPIAGVLIGWILAKIHQKKKVSFKLAAWFIFATWLTHVFIDCFNTYGTQIFEPFSDYRFSFNTLFIIDPFFTGPMLLGLIVCVIFCKSRPKLRVFTQWTTTVWLCLYFVASITFKIMAERHFADRFNQWGVTPIRVMSSPMPLNIFGWRGVAQDDEKFYVTYWSLFDNSSREYEVSEFETGRHLEKDFKSSKEFQTLRWFSKGWRKSYQLEGEPDSLYISLVMMGEMRVNKSEEQVFKPPFLWKITKKGDEFEFTRPYKMSTDWGTNLASIGSAVKLLTSRVSGGEPDWMKGTWIWDFKEQE